MKIRPPGVHDNPQILGREEALVRLGIPAPTQFQVSKMFPNLVDIRIQRDRWRLHIYMKSGDATKAVSGQGGISRQQMSVLESMYGGGGNG